MPPEFTLRTIGTESDVLLRNLFEHYLHDMAEWFQFDTQADGSYAYDTQSAVWQAGYDAYLTKIGESLAGFAIVGPAPVGLLDPGSDPTSVTDMHEFFVIRRFRRTGLGRAMARDLWNRYPGNWLVRVYEPNLPAVPFWRSAVADYTEGTYREERRLVRERPWRFFTFEAPHARRVS